MDWIKLSTDDILHNDYAGWQNYALIKYHALYAQLEKEPTMKQLRRVLTPKELKFVQSKTQMIQELVEKEIQNVITKRNQSKLTYRTNKGKNKNSDGIMSADGRNNGKADKIRIDKSNNIHIQKTRISEATVQSEFYLACKKSGLICVLEYKVPGSRFDAVIFDANNNITHIVETKSYSIDKEPNLDTVQLRRYRKYGPKVIVVGRLEQIERSVSEIQEDVKSKIKPYTVDEVMETGRGIMADKKSGFIKPTEEEIKAYCQERKNNVNPQRFFDYYQANGWKVGRNPMKDWKATVRYWEKGTTKATEKESDEEDKRLEEAFARLKREKNGQN